MNVTYNGGSVFHSLMASETLPERLVCGYLTLIPLLWALGLNLPAAFLVIFGTFLLYVRSRFAWSHALPWFLVGTMQIVSVLVNWDASKQPWWMVGKHLLASYVSGWFLLGAAIGIGASGIVRPAELYKAITRLTFCTALLAVPTILASLLLPQEYMYVLTPIGHLMPASLPSRAYSFGMFFYNWDDIAGLHLPRVALFYPWPTALGFAGICTIFVFLGNPSHWRTLGVVCGLGMVLGSLGRTAIIATLICFVVRWTLTWPGRIQAAAAFGVAAVLLSSWLFTTSPVRMMADLEQSIEQSRPGASQARNDVYEASWEGIRHAPVLGHGWPGAAVEDNGSVYGDQQNMMVVGSHSTISGLLYKGGAITFGAFLLVFARMGVVLLRTSRFHLSRDGLAVLTAILLTCTNEGLESLVFPTLFVFLWLGTILLHSDVMEGRLAYNS